MAGVYQDQEISSKLGNHYVTHDVEDYVPPTTDLPSFRAGSADDGHIVSQHEQQNLVRGLGQRHIQMIAIAGAIVSTYPPTEVDPIISHKVDELILQ